MEGVKGKEVLEKPIMKCASVEERVGSCQRMIRGNIGLER